MPNPFKIDIGRDGFKGPDKQPKFKVKQNRSVVFNLVDGAQPVDVYFSAGSPFAESTIPVGSSGSGELVFRDGTVGNTYKMEVRAPGTVDSTLSVMDGKTGDIEVDPFP